MARIITITSGKGGVGKTSISLNLSLSLASRGFRVCLFDADLGLANVNILTGLYPKKDLESVISGQFSLKEIIIKDYQGIDIIPGSSGVEKIADLTQTQTGTLISAFLDLEDYDYFIFDTSAGISAQVLSFCMASHEIILVATCEPTSLTDAYSMLKVLSKYEYDSPVKVVINQVTSGRAAQKAYAKLKETVQRFLSIKVEPLGIVATDKNVRAAVISQTPFFMLFPDTLASKCIKSLTDKLISRAHETGDLPLEIFWDKCLSFLKKHHASKKEQVPEKETKKEKALADPEMTQAVARIELRLSQLFKEVGEIRQILKGQEQARKVAAPAAVVVSAEPLSKAVSVAPVAPAVEGLGDPREILLDFEAWRGN